MLPGFGLKESKAFLPIFKDCAEAVSMKWVETIGSSDNRAVVINVVDWLSRGTLDAIGQGMISFLCLLSIRLNWALSQQRHSMSNLVLFKTMRIPLQRSTAIFCQ